MRIYYIAWDNDYCEGRVTDFYTSRKSLLQAWDKQFQKEIIYTKDKPSKTYKYNRFKGEIRVTDYANTIDETGNVISKPFEFESVYNIISVKVHK